MISLFTCLLLEFFGTFWKRAGKFAYEIEAIIIHFSYYLAVDICSACFKASDLVLYIFPKLIIDLVYMYELCISYINLDVRELLQCKYIHTLK